MKCILLVDFGSTYTKLWLIDSCEKKLIKRVSSYTTAKSNIITGFEIALEKLKQEVGFNNMNIVKTLICSSAAGGLKIISIGITPEFTVEASKRAAMSAGGRVVKSYSYFLSKFDIIEINEIDADIILLSGGVNGGNTNYILENSKMLSKLEKDIPIIVAGNEIVRDEISEIFNKNKKEYYIADNIMPDTDKMNLYAVKDIIRNLFISKITKANGMENIKKISDEVIIPTPTAVLSGAELIANGTKTNQGLGEIIVIDVGGATTDVHSISEPIKDKSFLIEGLVESYVKRTVEGDLGMRHSSLGVLEVLEQKKFFNKDDIVKAKIMCQKRFNNPEYVADSFEEAEFDDFLAKKCIDISLERHCGNIRKTYINGRNAIIQEGKDLRYINYIIGTGGVLVNSQNSEKILRNIIAESNRDLFPKTPSIIIDNNYLMVVVGLLSFYDIDLAFEVFKNQGNKFF